MFDLILQDVLYSMLKGRDRVLLPSIPKRIGDSVAIENHLLHGS
jgi:hypothetical protein